MLNRLINGVLIVIVGAILLMNTTGYLPWSVWQAAVEYWPVIIIGLGIQVAFSKWRIPGVALAIIAILVLAILHPFPKSLGFPNRLFFQRAPMSKPLEYSKQLEVPLDSEVSALKISLVAPALDMEAKGDHTLGQDSEYAILGELSWDRYEPLVEVLPANNGSDMHASVKSPVSEGKDAGKQNWNMRFHPSLPIEMTVTGGAIDLNLDLASFFVEHLTVSAGVANVELNFGLTGQESTVVISGGVANIGLVVPESAGLKVTVSGAPLATRVKTNELDLIKQGKSWVSRGYSSASTKINVTVSCGAGSIKLKSSP